MTHLSAMQHFYMRTLNALNCLQPLALLAVRYWLFTVFFYSGWLKTKSWETTLYLFANTYHVPLLPSNVAAYLGTTLEISLPILIMAGLFTRVSAFVLILFNLVILASYPFLWTADGAMGLRDHYHWITLSFLIMAFGAGKLSIDYLIKRKWGKAD